MPMMWILKNLGLGLRQNSSVYSIQQSINGEIFLLPWWVQALFSARGSSWCCSSHTSLGFLPQPSASSPSRRTPAQLFPETLYRSLEVSLGADLSLVLQGTLPTAGLFGPPRPCLGLETQNRDLGAIVGHILGFSSLRDHCLIMRVSFISCISFFLFLQVRE